MSTPKPIRIELTDEQSTQVGRARNSEANLGRVMMQLEQRITPLVVIAIIAILIGLLVPAV